MLRGIRLFTGLAAVLIASGGVAHAQYYGGYGRYGWGGWGGASIQGDFARGMGSFYEGVGDYNRNTAIAESINADTVGRINQYLYEANKESRRRYGAYLARKNNTNKDDYDKRIARIRDNPSPDDIASGDALNVILDQMTNPNVTKGSTLRLATAPISAAAIRDIPFRDDTDAITISLDQLTAKESWPEVLRGPEFQAEREAYEKAVDDALEEDKDDGDLKPETIRRVRDTVSQLYAKADKTYTDRKRPEHLQAINYLKGLSGLSRILERPNLTKVLSELEKVENTTLGNLVAFMHSYSLRFGPATTPQQQAVYQELYPIMVAQRDKLIGRPGADEEKVAKSSPINDPAGIFYGFDPKHLHPASDPSTNGAGTGTGTSSGTGTSAPVAPTPPGSTPPPAPAPPAPQ